MNDEKNLISLKEASELTGYSADYIGQLIRQGKIRGKQVYTNIAWMTTAEEVLAYKNKGKKKQEKTTMKDKIIAQSRLFGMQMNMLKLIFKSFKQAIPIMVFILILFFTLVFYIFFAFFAPDKAVNVDSIPVRTEQNEIRF